MVGMDERAIDSTNKVTIFTDSNLGTHIALSVPPDIAGRDFKKQLEMAHFKCFPESKEIEVYGLMVKRKSCFYYLPDSVPIKLAFEGVRGSWFLHVEARTLFSVDSVTEDIDPNANDSGVVDPLEPENCVTSVSKSDEKVERNECWEKESQSYNLSPVERTTSLVYVSRKKRKRKKDEGDFLLSKYLEASVLPGNDRFDPPQGSRSVTEVPSGVFSEVKSVTSIIRRYFPNSIEKTGLASPTSSDGTSKRTRTKRVCSRSSIQLEVGNLPGIFLMPSLSDRAVIGSTISDGEIGERLVMASNNLGLSSSKKKSALCCRKANCLVKRSVFEISDSDE